jgi:MFS family permease
MFLGIGLFFGSLVYGKFGSKFSKRKVINFGLLTTGLIIVLFTVCLKLMPSFFIAGILSIALGVFSAPIIVSSNTLLHEVMHNEMRGRIFSSLEIIMHIGFLLFMFLASITAEKIGRDWVLVTIGILFSIIGLVKLIRLRKEKDRV